MGGLSDFQREQFVGARLARASVTKTATLLGVSKAAVPKVMTAYKNHGKTSSSKRNSGRKQTRCEGDCHTLKKIASKIIVLLQQKWQQNSIFILKTQFPQNCPKRDSQIQYPR
jgi:predicted transcriptional regulator